MSNYSNIGELKVISFEDIQSSNSLQSSDFLINAAAQILIKNGKRNWVPLIVKESTNQSFHVVGNSFVYDVAKVAGLETVWCIVTDASPEAEETAKVLAQEILPKINLSIATRDEIESALKYLLALPGSPLKSIKLITAIEKIYSADRQYWQTFEPVTKLGCSITKGKKLDAFQEAFYLTPSPPKLTPLPLPEVRRTLKVTELRKFAKERNIPGVSKLSKTVLLEQLQSFD